MATKAVASVNTSLNTILFVAGLVGVAAFVAITYIALGMLPTLWFPEWPSTPEEADQANLIMRMIPDFVALWVFGFAAWLTSWKLNPKKTGYQPKLTGRFVVASAVLGALFVELGISFMSKLAAPATVYFDATLGWFILVGLGFTLVVGYWAAGKMLDLSKLKG